MELMSKEEIIKLFAEFLEQGNSEEGYRVSPDMHFAVYSAIQHLRESEDNVD